MPLPLPLAVFKVRVAAYDPQWPILFDVERSRLRALLADRLDPADFVIEHVGSTSVPGLHAKPIIDIAVRIRDFRAVRPWIVDLLPAEYFTLIDRGTPGGRLLLGQVAPLAVRLHVYDWDSPLWLAQTHFRDYLRVDEDARALYAGVKRIAALRFPNNARAYHRCKSGTIERLQLRALRQAGIDDPTAMLRAAAATYGTSGGDGGSGGDGSGDGDGGDGSDPGGTGVGDGGDGSGGDSTATGQTVVVETPDGYRVYWNGGEGWEPEHGKLLDVRNPERQSSLDPYAVEWFDDGNGGEWRATFYIDPITDQPIVEWAHLPKGYS